MVLDSECSDATFCRFLQKRAMESGDSRIDEDINELLPLICANTSPTNKDSSKKSCSDELWHGHYCCMSLCCYLSAENTERACFGLPCISFYSFSREKARAQQWVSKIQWDPGSDFVINRNTKVCSEHFNADDYSGKDPQAARCVLKKTAVPYLFPLNSDKVFQCTMRNSNKTDSTQLSETSQQHCMELVSAEGMEEVGRQLNVE